MEATSSSII